MKLYKHNGITQINNSFAGRLKQGALPVQCLTVGAATLPSKRNVLNTNITHTLSIFFHYYAKKRCEIFTQTLRKYNYARCGF